MCLLFQDAAQEVTPGPPSIFSVEIPLSVWEEFHVDEPTGPKMKPGWADAFSSFIEEHNSLCVFHFKRNRFSKSRGIRTQRQQVYWTAKGKCAHEYCWSVVLQVDKKPSDEGASVIVRVHCEGSFRHIPGEIHRRKLRFWRREAVADSLRGKTQSALFLQVCMDMLGLNFGKHGTPGMSRKKMLFGNSACHVVPIHSIFPSFFVRREKKKRGSLFSPFSEKLSLFSLFS